MISQRDFWATFRAFLAHKVMTHDWFLPGIFVSCAVTLALMFALDATSSEEQAALARANAECEAQGKVMVELREGRSGIVHDRFCFRGTKNQP